MSDFLTDGMKINGYTDYDQMSDLEKRKVDGLYESYKSGGLDGTSTEQVEYFIAKRLNKEVIKQINNKLDQAEYQRNYQGNAMRQQLFEDRVKNGFYGDRYPHPQMQGNSEVAALRKEVSEMKNTIGELTKLLNEKLK